MAEGLVRVRDFARDCGCTAQNVYKHLRNYADQLEGHTFHGVGKQGILLDAFACNFLQSLMYPKELTESAVADEINALRAQIMEQSVRMAEMSKELAGKTSECDALLREATEHQRLLTAHEGTIADLQTNLQTANDRADKAEAELEQERAKQKALKESSFFGKLRWAFGKEEA